MRHSSKLKAQSKEFTAESAEAAEKRLKKLEKISHPRGIGFAPMKPASRFIGQAFHKAGRHTRTGRYKAGKLRGWEVRKLGR